MQRFRLSCNHLDAHRACIDGLTVPCGTPIPDLLRTSIWNEYLDGGSAGRVSSYGTSTSAKIEVDVTTSLARPSVSRRNPPRL